MKVGQLHQGALQALANLPVRSRQCEGGWELTGVDPHLVDRLLTRHVGPGWCTRKRICLLYTSDAADDM
eukprot:10606852-Prorocentrum_lima.AAC.1